MKRVHKISAFVVGLLLLVVSPPVEAKKKIWNVEQYRTCAREMPSDELDTSRGISSVDCKRSSQVVSQDQFRGSNLTADPLVLIAKATSGGDWVTSII